MILQLLQLFETDVALRPFSGNIHAIIGRIRTIYSLLEEAKRSPPRCSRWKVTRLSDTNTGVFAFLRGTSERKEIRKCLALEKWTGLPEGVVTRRISRVSRPPIGPLTVFVPFFFFFHSFQTPLDIPSLSLFLSLIEFLCILHYHRRFVIIVVQIPGFSSHSNRFREKIPSHRRT